MGRKAAPFIVVFGILLLFLLTQSMFFVQPGEVVVLTRPGTRERKIYERGLGFKIPFFQQAARLDTRVAAAFVPRVQATLGNGESVAVWAELLWVASNPLDFIEKYSTEEDAERYLGTLTTELIQQTVSSYTTHGGIVENRPVIGKLILDELNHKLDGTGLTVTELSLSRLEPADTSALLLKMRTSWQDHAGELFSQTRAEAERLKTKADEERAEILAQAVERGLTIKGKGEAEAARILGQAFSASPKEFQDFFIKMESERRKAATGAPLAPHFDDNSVLQHF